MSGIVDWGTFGMVVGVGLLVGAGVPALFALGLRLLTADSPERAPGEAAVAGAARPSALSRAAGILCLTVCAAAIVTGLAFLVAGGH